jgi:hypothetical protein
VSVIHQIRANPTSALPKRENTCPAQMVKNGSFQPLLKVFLLSVFVVIFYLLFRECRFAAVDFKQRNAKVPDADQESEELCLVSNIPRNQGFSISQFCDPHAFKALEVAVREMATNSDGDVLGSWLYSRFFHVSFLTFLQDWCDMNINPGGLICQ